MFTKHFKTAQVNILPRNAFNNQREHCLETRPRSSKSLKNSLILNFTFQNFCFSANCLICSFIKILEVAACGRTPLPAPVLARARLKASRPTTSIHQKNVANRRCGIAAAFRQTSKKRRESPKRYCDRISTDIKGTSRIAAAVGERVGYFTS